MKECACKVRLGLTVSGMEDDLGLFIVGFHHMFESLSSALKSPGFSELEENAGFCSELLSFCPEEVKGNSLQ